MRLQPRSGFAPPAPIMALTDRRGVSLRLLWAIDPFFLKWLTQTRRLMRRYRVRADG